MSDVITRIVISAKDTATGVFKKTGLQIENLKRKVFSLNSAVAGFGLGYSWIELYRSGKNFETVLNDMSKVTDRNLGLIRQDIASLPPELGNATELMRGYYQVISSGVTAPAKALDLITTSAKAAKGAHVSQELVVKALTKTMAGYAGEIENATEASDLLFAIEKVGQTNFAELVPVMGDLATLSHALGINTEELGGALALVTQTAGSTSQAATQYQAVLRGLYKPTKNMEELLSKLGYHSGKELISEKGFVGVLRLITAEAKQSGTGLGKLFESSEALTGLNAMLTDSFTSLVEKIQAVKEGSGGTIKAWEQWLTTADAIETAMKNELGNALTMLGTELLPTAKDRMKEFTTWVGNNKGEIKEWGKDVGTVLTSAGSGVSSLMSTFNSMPEWMKEASGMGLIGGMLFGPKGAAVLTLFGVATDNIRNLAEELEMVATGEMSWWDHLTAAYGDDRAKEIKAKRGTLEGLEEERSRYVHKRKSTYYASEQEHWDSMIAEVDQKIANLKKELAATKELASLEAAARQVPIVVANTTQKPIPNANGSGSTPKLKDKGNAGVVTKTSTPLAGMMLESDKMKLALRSYVAEQDVAMKQIESLYSQGKVTVADYYEAKRQQITETTALEQQAVSQELADTVASYNVKISNAKDEAEKQQLLNELTREKQSLQTRLFEIEQKRAGSMIVLADHERQALENAAKATTEAWKDSAKQMEQSGETVAAVVGDAMADLALGAELSFESMANSIIRSLMRIYVTQPLVEGFGGIFGKLGQSLFSSPDASVMSSVGAGNGLGLDIIHSSQSDSIAGLFSGSYTSAIGQHLGGVVGQSATFTRSVPSALFDGAQRYHNGGPILRPGEVPIIAEIGERMLTREENAAYSRMKGQRPAAPEFHVHIENEKGVQSEVIHEDSFFDGERWIASAWIKAHKNNTGGLRDYATSGR